MSYLLECMTGENVLSMDDILPYQISGSRQVQVFLVMVLQELFLVKQRKKCDISSL